MVFYSFVDVFFIAVVYGENVFWAVGDFLLAVMSGHWEILGASGCRKGLIRRDYKVPLWEMKDPGFLQLGSHLKSGYDHSSYPEALEIVKLLHASQVILYCGILNVGN